MYFGVILGYIGVKGLGAGGSDPALPVHFSVMPRVINGTPSWTKSRTFEMLWELDSAP